MNLEILCDNLSGCEKCVYIKDGERPVQPFYGKYPQYIFCGFVPDKEDKLYGEAFSEYTRKGKNLRRLIELSGLSLRYCYFTYIVKCHTESKTVNKIENIYPCYCEWLDNEIKQIKPKAIYAMGKKTVEFFSKFNYNDYPIYEVADIHKMLTLSDKAVIKQIEEGIYDKQELYSGIRL